MNSENGLTRRDFFKKYLIPGAAATLSVGLGIDKLFSPKGKLESSNETNTDPNKALTIKEMCPIQPLCIRSNNEPISKINLPYSEIISTYSEVPSTQDLTNEKNILPRVNHARAKNIPNELNDITNLFQIGPYIFPSQKFEQIEISENTNPVIEAGKPIRISTALSQKDNSAIVAAFYKPSNINSGWNESVKKQVIEEDPNLLLTEMFSLTDLANGLVMNSYQELGLKSEELCNLTIDQTMILSTECVVARFNIANRQGLIAFDPTSRKPVDIFDLSKLDPNPIMRGDTLGVSVYDTNINQADFRIANGVLLSEEGKDTILDIENGIIASSEQRGHRNLRFFYSLAFSPEHLHNETSHVRGMPAKEATLQQASLRILPFSAINLEKSQTLSNAYNPKNPLSTIKALNETTFLKEELSTSQPPKLIARLPYLFEIDPESPTLKVTKIDLFENSRSENSLGKVITSQKIDITSPIDKFPKLVINNNKNNLPVNNEQDIELTGIRSPEIVLVPHRYQTQGDLVLGDSLAAKPKYQN